MDRQICHAHCPKGGSLWPVAAILAVLAIPSWAAAAIGTAVAVILIAGASLAVITAGVLALGFRERRSLPRGLPPRASLASPYAHAIRRASTPQAGSRRNVIPGDYEVKVIER
jgi:hypothetical protein